jgi:hypothetical protein
MTTKSAAVRPVTADLPRFHRHVDLNTGGFDAEHRRIRRLLR